MLLLILSDMAESQFKVVLLGEGCVGKTSILLRYVKNEFVGEHIQTIQASFLPKRLNIEGKTVKLAIWVHIQLFVFCFLVTYHRIQLVKRDFMLLGQFVRVT